MRDSNFRRFMKNEALRQDEQYKLEEKQTEI